MFCARAGFHKIMSFNICRNRLRKGSVSRSLSGIDIAYTCYTPPEVLSHDYLTLHALKLPQDIGVGDLDNAEETIVQALISIYVQQGNDIEQ